VYVSVCDLFFEYVLRLDLSCDVCSFVSGVGLF